MTVISSLIPTAIAAPPTNPAYLGTVSRPLAIIDTSLGTSSYNLSTGSAIQTWYFLFNFNTHPLMSITGDYLSSVSYVTVSGPDNKLQAVTNNLYNNYIGVTIQGGTIGSKYTLTVGGVLNNANILTASLNINIKT